MFFLIISDCSYECTVWQFRDVRSSNVHCSYWCLLARNAVTLAAVTEEKVRYMFMTPLSAVFNENVSG